MEEVSAARIDALEKFVGDLLGRVEALTAALAIRAESRRVFDERPISTGLSVWHGEWERVCAQRTLEELLRQQPAAVNTQRAYGYAHVVLELAEVLQPSDPSDG